MKPVKPAWPPLKEQRAPITVNLTSLRKALGGTGLVFEAAEAPELAKASGRPGVNVARIWSFMTTSVYKSGDLPVLAVREMVQNSVDGIRAAIRSRKIRAGTGRIDVSWDGYDRSLTVRDNGIGMDADTILNKFLSLGDSGKGGAGSDDEAAGGFGVAKAVILGTSRSFTWEMRTRDNRVVSEGADKDVQVYDAPFLQGTEIVIKDVGPEFARTWDYQRQEHVEIKERLREVLAANDLPGIELRLDGRIVQPLFSRRGGSKVEVDGSWGRGSSATVKAYRRAPGDRQGAYYLRLSGLFQFKAPSQRGNLKADVVIDLTSTERPGSSQYPFNAARDSLQRNASWAFSTLVEEVERENESIGRNMEDEVYDPEAEGAAERRGAEQLAELTASAFDDPRFLAALELAAGGVADYYREQVGQQAPAVVESAAPAGSKRPRKGDAPTRSLPPGIGGTVATVVAADIADVPKVAGQLRGILADSDKAWTAGGGSEIGIIVDSWVERALDRAEAGEELDQHDVHAINKAVEKASNQALGPTGGGIVQAATTARIADSIIEQAARPESKPRRKRNPFGGLAGLRISKKNYNRAKGRRFKTNFARWLPFLAAWDSTLRLITAASGIRRRFKPGFVLDDELLGLTTGTVGGVGTSVVYIHPDRMAQVVKAHKERPLAVAAFLHGIACHELTHLDGRMGDGHDEGFVAAREDLGNSTGHLLPAIAILVTNLLDLKPPLTAAEKRVVVLERKLAAGEDVKRELRAARAKIKTQQQGTAVLLRELAEAQAESRRVAQSIGTCGTCRCEERAKLAAITAAVRANPPPGVTPDHVDGFVSRNEAALLDALAARRARGRPGNVPEDLPAT